MRKNVMPIKKKQQKSDEIRDYVLFDISERLNFFRRSAYSPNMKNTRKKNYYLTIFIKCIIDSEILEVYTLHCDVGMYSITITNP